MGKRSAFRRLKGDFYETFDPRAVAPVLPFLQGKTFVEPCAGAGALIAQLRRNGFRDLRCFDVDPVWPGIERRDALTLRAEHIRGADMIITNPPWTRPILHALIRHFVTLGPPVWLLFDADWLFTKQAGEFRPMLRDVIAVGRVRWIPGTTDDGKDNAAWYRFGLSANDDVRFHMRRGAA